MKFYKVEDIPTSCYLYLKNQEIYEICNYINSTIDII